MGKLTFFGFLASAVVFILLVSLILANITVGGETVTINGFPTTTEPISALDWVWDNTIGQVDFSLW